MASHQGCGTAPPPMEWHVCRSMSAGSARLLPPWGSPLRNVMERGGRADYRSSVVERVLEISGTERLAELGRRHRDKVAQALANPFRWDAYLVTCAFCAEGNRA